MRLNHVDLQVSDIGAARELFETFFGLRWTYQREGQIAVLEDDGGFSFGLSNLHGSLPPVYPPDFHVGFVLASRVGCGLPHAAQAGEEPTGATAGRSTERFSHAAPDSRAYTLNGNGYLLHLRVTPIGG